MKMGELLNHHQVELIIHFHCITTDLYKAYFYLCSLYNIEKVQNQDSGDKNMPCITIL